MIKKTMMIIAAGLLLMSASGAQASQLFNYSYMFPTGDIVSGSFNGTANGNLINGLSNITASLNGTPFLAGNNAYGVYNAGRTTDWIAGAAVASFDGTQNDFVFIDSNFPTDTNYTKYFYLIPWETTVDVTNAGQFYSSTPFSTAQLAGDPGYYVDWFNGNYNAANWSVTAVPEPGTMMLLGAGFLGLAVFTKRRKNA